MSDQDDGPAHSGITSKSLGSGALSSSSSMSPSTTSSSGSQIKSSVSECLGAWLNYLQLLNNLCASGYRLAHTMVTLGQWGHQIDSSNQNMGQTGQQQGNLSNQQNHGTPPIQTSLQFTGAWDDLARATAVATSTVKSHIVSILQDFITSLVNTNEQEGDQQKIRDHNQQLIMECAQTMVSLQHQFCVASYESFSSLMCCFICQAPVGYSHDVDCALLHQKNYGTNDQRSQTPSPHFGTLISQKLDPVRYHLSDMKSTTFGSGSTHTSSEHGFGHSGIDQQRGPSPHQEVRGPSPIQGFLENIRGPLPNPGHLLGMKAPFYRGSRSPLNYPLFPLNCQRRWSEAAAGEVRTSEPILDAESQMRRWSMPWEVIKTDKNAVTWHQTRIMPISKLAVPASKNNSDRSQSTTPDSFGQPSVSSQDGLAEAIQLLSCRPTRNLSMQQIISTQQHQPIGPPFIEEPATYEMWPRDNHERVPCIKFPSKGIERDDSNNPI